MPFSGKLEVGMMVGWEGKTGTIYLVHPGGDSATIKWDDGTVGTGHSIQEKPYYGNRGWIIDRNNYGSWGGNGIEGTLKIISKPPPDYKIKAHISRTKKKIDLCFAVQPIGIFDVGILTKEVKKAFSRAYQQSKNTKSKNVI